MSVYEFRQVSNCDRNEEVMIDPRKGIIINNEENRSEEQFWFCDKHPLAVKYAKETEQHGIMPPDLGVDIRVKVSENDILCLKECRYNNSY